MPQSRIASRTSSGVRNSGPVTVSVSGMPRRSVRQTMRCPLSETSRHESSSTLTCVTVSLRPWNGIQPFMPTIAVRWNPVGIEPSRYCFRAMCTSSMMSRCIIRHSSILMSIASWFTRNGGVSSISYVQTLRWFRR